MPGAARTGVRSREYGHRHPPRPHRRSMRRVARTALAILALALATSAQTPVAALPPGAERAYSELAARVDGGAAMDIVRFMDRYWRLSGNPGFNASVDRIRDGLTA